MGLAQALILGCQHLVVARRRSTALLQDRLLLVGSGMGDSLERLTVAHNQALVRYRNHAFSLHLLDFLINALPRTADELAKFSLRKIESNPYTAFFALTGHAKTPRELVELLAQSSAQLKRDQVFDPLKESARLACV